MEGADLNRLLESVLAVDVQDIARFEQLVNNLGTQLQTAGEETRTFIKSRVEAGIRSGDFDRSNAELLLLYLDTVISGAPALRLETQLKPKVIGRESESEESITFTSAYALYLQGRGLDPDPDRLLNGAKSICMLANILNNAARRPFNQFWDESGLRRSTKPAGVRVMVANVAIAQQRVLSNTMLDLLIKKWEDQEVETEIKHQLELKMEVCKRLATQYRRALDFKANIGMNRWKITAQRAQRLESPGRQGFERQLTAEEIEIRDQHWRWQQKERVVRFLIKMSPVQTEQLAFWRWKINSQRPKIDPRPMAEALEDQVRSRKRQIFKFWHEQQEKKRDREEKLRALLRNSATCFMFRKQIAILLFMCGKYAK